MLQDMSSEKFLIKTEKNEIGFFQNISLEIIDDGSYINELN